MSPSLAAQPLLSQHCNSLGNRRSRQSFEEESFGSWTPKCWGK